MSLSRDKEADIIVISDTGALISLEKISEGFSFIQKLYDHITIPPSVYQEYQIKGNLDPYIHSGFIQVQHRFKNVNFPFQERLHDGEIEAISLCSSYRENSSSKVLLLIEEESGREFADILGIDYSGIVGQIQKAFFQNIIDQKTALNYLDQMRRSHRVNKKIYSLIRSNIEFHNRN